MSDTPRGMVDSLAGQGGGPTEEQLAYALAYLADGPMDPAVLALLADPERIARREQDKADRMARDWPGLGHYRDANAMIADQTTELVFIGDSITEMWGLSQPDLFAGGVVNRGVSGQTSPQILLRFMADVVALKPRAVHVMCGVNDIAGNTGPNTPGDYRNAVLAMLDLATAHGIAVILAGVTPLSAFTWAPEIERPGARAIDLNRWLAGTAEARGLVFADYHAVLADADGGLRADLTRDGVHPTSRGYAVMRPVADRAIAAVLGARSSSGRPARPAPAGRTP